MGGSNSDDFKKADIEHGEFSPAPAGLILGDNSEEETSLTSSPRDVLELRKKLVKQHYRGSSSLVEKLENEGRNSLEGLVMSLVDEVVKETDSLLANELVSIQEGNLRDASIISYKRSEVLEKAIKAVQAKQVFEKENGVDVDSPSMLVVFKYFMGKVQDVFKGMNTDDELSDTFFRTLASGLSDWKKELGSELNDLDKLDG